MAADDLAADEGEGIGNGPRIELEGEERGLRGREERGIREEGKAKRKKSQSSRDLADGRPGLVGFLLSR